MFQGLKSHKPEFADELVRSNEKGPPSEPSTDHISNQLLHSVCVVFDRWWDVCGLYLCPGSPITQISTPLEMSGIPNHTDLHPGRNVYSTSHFILSVLFFTGGETSVVPRCVWDPPSHNFHPGRNIHPTSWVILSVLFFTGGGMSVVPTCVWDPPSHRSPPQ